MKKKETTEEKIFRLMSISGYTLAIAESCTGGLLCHKITNTSGSSKYFIGGVIAYNNEIKEQLLNVSSDILKKFGAVSRETAIAMARGVKNKLGCDIGLSITGIAGPTGGSIRKPVGTVFTAISSRTKEEDKKFCLKGTRHSIKLKASNKALYMLKEFISTKRSGW